MYAKLATLITATLFFALLQTSPVYAATAREYLDSGRASLFDGTLSGIRQAHATFQQGINDASCVDCQTHRELLFFHAVSRIAMWAVREDGQPANSALEIAKAYGTDVTGDALREIIVTEPIWPENRYGQPVIPANYEQLIGQLAAFMETDGLPELESVIAELEQITETPEDRFRVFLTPEETSIFVALGDPLYTSNVEVDFADVLLLKGVLYTAKGVLTAKSAYDTQVDPRDRLLEKVWEDCFSIENDLLLPHPDFLKLLPTANDPVDGKAIMAQARDDIFTALQYYFDVIDSIGNENIPDGADPQDDELFSIDPNDQHVCNQMKEKLILLNDSLRNDTPLMVDEEARMNYYLSNDTDSMVFVLTQGPSGNIKDSWICLQDNSNEQFYHCHLDTETTLADHQLFVFLDDIQQNLHGFFQGTLSNDRSTITNASFEYWGTNSGTIQGLSGSCTYQPSEQQWTLDVNPVLGSSPRYPNPISPRDYLPQLDKWNTPQPGTLPDPTFGGVLPLATETDWLGWINPQPDASLYWPLLHNWQMYTPIDSETQWPAFWLNEQRVFTDATGELDPQLPPGLDIQEFYLALNGESLYGSFLLADPVEPPYSGHQYRYVLNLSYSPTNPEAPDSLRFEVFIDGNNASGIVFYRQPNGSGWRQAGMCNVLFYPNQIDFSVPVTSLPAGISGRYLSVESSLSNSYIEGGDQNNTHVQIGLTGTISGTVAFPGHLGGPIFVQAYNDKDDPEGSLVACCTLDAPGPFTLERIGLGWQGFVRAVSPMFGDYHPLDMNALKAEDVSAISLRVEDLSNVVLGLQLPPVLETTWDQSYWYYDYVDPDINLRDYYAFDAIAGISYRLSLTTWGTNARITLLDRNGHEVIRKLESWEAPALDWLCPVDGRYYIEVSEPENNRVGGSYGVKVIAYWDCPEFDISGAQWEGVKDCRVDLNDFALLANQWFEACSGPYWCGGGDLNRNGEIELIDLMMLSSEWMEVGFGRETQISGDNFETGDFSANPWQFGGNRQWTITSDSAYEGSFSAKSGPISHYQSCSISFTQDTTGCTAISFANRVSTEGWCDYLRFYIDGALNGSWSGTQGWTVQSYSIEPGTHTFTWEYTKDGSVNTYPDCVWIDDIHFN